MKRMERIHWPGRRADKKANECARDDDGVCDSMQHSVLWKPGEGYPVQLGMEDGGKLL